MRVGVIGQCQICALKILQTASCVLEAGTQVEHRQREQQVKGDAGRTLDGEEWFREA